MFSQSAHDVFEKVPAENAVLRRYLDLTKVLALFQTKTLTFTRSDSLADPLEGTVSPANIALRPAWYKDTPGIIEKLNNLDPYLRSAAYVNSWQANEHEAISMWERYGSTPGSMAIETNWNRLKSSLEGEIEVFGGLITYQNRKTHPVPESNILFRHMYKSLAYADEQELRLLVMGNIAIQDSLSDISLVIPVNLEKLVEKVVLAPNTQTWRESAIREALNGIAPNVSISRSALEE